MEEDRGSDMIGSIEANKDFLRVFLLVPSESIAELTILAATDRLQTAYLNGTPIRYRHATVRSLSLNTEKFDPEEW